MYALIGKTGKIPYFWNKYLEMNAPATKKTRIKKKDIPDYLLYEMDEGKPIYYRDYKDVLKGTKPRNKS